MMRPFDLSAENTEAMQMNKIMRIYKLYPLNECLETTAGINKENDERQYVILCVIKKNLGKNHLDVFCDGLSLPLPVPKNEG